MEGVVSEFRRDILTNRWVIVAPERSLRPNAFGNFVNEDTGTESCPFCPGREHMTPSAVLSFGPRSDGSGSSPWLVRVVPNLYPALKTDGSLDIRAEGALERMQGFGAHEVVIETPDHRQDPTEYDLPHMRAVLWAYRDRISELFRDKRFRCILAFKNFGSAAGATIAHSHSQLIALPMIPKAVEEEIEGARSYFSQKSRCLICDMIEREAADGRRMILSNGGFAAYAPYASRFPFEVRIAPRRHQAQYQDLTGEELQSLAEILRDVLRRYEILLNSPAYSYALHATPPDSKEAEPFHWHLDVFPKLTEAGGFEWGSGVHVNTVSPEDAAERLRGVSDTTDFPPGYLLALSGGGSDGA